MTLLSSVIAVSDRHFWNPWLRPWLALLLPSKQNAQWPIWIASVQRQFVYINMHLVNIPSSLVCWRSAPCLVRTLYNSHWHVMYIGIGIFEIFRIDTIQVLMNNSPSDYFYIFLLLKRYQQYCQAVLAKTVMNLLIMFSFLAISLTLGLDIGACPVAPGR